jgi:hypothetical protein
MTEVRIAEIGTTGMPKEVIRKGKDVIRAEAKIDGGVVGVGRGAVGVTVQVE